MLIWCSRNIYYCHY